VDMRRNESIQPRREGDRLFIPLPTEASRTEVVRICRPAAWERERRLRLASALERAGREWAWVKAQHDDSLTVRLGFEENKGRWFRYDFDGAEVGLCDEAHSGRSSLLVEAPTAVDGTIRSEPFATKWELAHRARFYYRVEGAGTVRAKLAFRPSWFGGEKIGETEPSDLPCEGSWADGWRRFEAEVQPVKDTRRTYLQLDFSSFRGRFAIDSMAFAPVVKPLAEIPVFGFAELSAQLRTSVASGEDAQASALTERIEGRLETWKAAATKLPEGDAQRVAYEIAVLQDALELCQRRFP